MTEARPTAIVFGGERCATTALHTALGQHPDIYTSLVKELNYFLRDDYGRMPPWASPRIRAAAPKDHYQYEAVWRKGLEHKVRLESSPMYLRESAVASRIILNYYWIDLLAVLRHPVDQAWSMFRYLKDQATIESFEAHLASSDLVANSPFILREFGLHARHLAPWYEAAENCRNATEHGHGRPDAARIKIILFDDLIDHTDRTLVDLFEFLGVPPCQVDFTRANQASSVRIPYLNSLLSGIATVIKRGTRGWLSDDAGRQLQQAYRRLRAANLKTAEKLPPELRSELTDRYYRADVEALERLIGRDLSRWLAKPRPKVRRAQHRVGAMA